jgi:hypothetical protein
MSYELGGLEIGVPYPAGERDFSPLHNVQTVSET